MKRQGHYWLINQLSEVQAVKIDTGFRVLNRQYDRGNNLKVNLFVFGGRSVWEGYFERLENRPEEK